jgi:Uma2 family endonuclease
MTGPARAGTLAVPMAYAEAPIHRLSFDDVLRMYEAGILMDEDRVELLDGVLVDVTPSGPEHSGVVTWLNRHLVLSVGELEVRVQDTLIVEGGFLSPDLIVVDPQGRDRLPSTAHLAIEVSVTSHRRDVAKATRYAAADVAEYWIVDEPARRVRVHRRPGPTGYAEVTEYSDGDRIESAIAAAVDVTALLG